MTQQQGNSSTMGNSWLERCPVCKVGALSLVEDKKLLGVLTLHWVECDCGAVFHALGEEYKLMQVSDESNPVWQEYGKQSLTARAWRTIALGGLSDQKLAELERRPQKSRVDEAGITYTQRTIATALWLQEQGLPVEKSWLTVEDDSVCDTCQSNALAG